MFRKLLAHDQIREGLTASPMIINTATNFQAPSPGSAAGTIAKLSGSFCNLDEANALSTPGVFLTPMTSDPLDIDSARHVTRQILKQTDTGFTLTEGRALSQSRASPGGEMLESFDLERRTCSLFVFSFVECC